MKDRQMAIVYTQPNCAACDRVKGFLAEKRVSFEERVVTQDPVALKELLAKGFRATPVTVIGEEAIAGFAPSQLEDILGF